MTQLTNIVNWDDALRSTTFNITGVDQDGLHRIGDYDLAVFQVASNSNQRPHYHTYGDIDVFMVVAGSGVLHLAKIEHQRIVEDSRQSHEIKAGDTYRVDPYTLHSIENKSNEPIRVLNVAPGAHSAPMEGDTEHAVDIFFPE